MTLYLGTSAFGAENENVSEKRKMSVAEISARTSTSVNEVEVAEIQGEMDVLKN